MKLRVEHIIICGHSDCSAIKALDNEEDSDYYISIWLNNAKEAKERVDSKIRKSATPEEIKERYRLIELENIRLQMEHLKAHPLVKKNDQRTSRFLSLPVFRSHERETFAG
jgi:carbonic anhydrase